MRKPIRVQHPGQGSRIAEDGGHMRAIFNAINDGIFIADLATGQIIDVNEFGCRMFGYRRNELIGAQIATLTAGIPPYTEDAAFERMQSARLHGPQIFEWHVKTKSGAPIWVEISLRYAEFGTTPVLVAVVRDISERKQAADDLREAHAALTEAQAVAKVGSFTLDLLNKRTTWTEEAFRVLGFTPNSVIPSFETYLARIHPDDRAALTEAYDRSLRNHAPGSLEQRVVWTDGTVRVVRTRWRNFYGDDNKAVRTIGAVQDITESKTAEHALREERDFSAALIDSLPGFLALLDDHGRLVRWNQNLSDFTGLSSEQLRGRIGFSLFVEDDRPEAQSKLEETFRTGRSDVEFRLRGKTGASRLVRWTGRTIAANGAAQLLAVGIDITEVREAQAGVRASEQRLATIFNSVNDGIGVQNPQTGAFFEVNPRFCEMFGYPRDEILKRSVVDLSAGIPPYGPGDLEPVLRRALSGEAVTFEWLAKAKDGHTFWIEISARPAEYGGQSVLLSVVRDVTARKTLERQLVDNERKLSAIVKTVKAGILIVDPDKHAIVDVNPAAAKMFGAPSERMVGQDYQIVCPADTAKKPIADLYREVDNVEGVLLNAAGQSVPVLRSVSRVELADKTYLVDSFIDITERKRFEEQLTHIARTDALTGLPNRVVFVEALQNAISLANRTGEKFAVLYLDLDHFKDINDALGHPVGDLLLQEIAGRLRSSIRKSDLAARFGGDEFALIAKGITDPMDAAVLAQNVLDLVKAPCAIQDKQIRIGASIGIAYYDRAAPAAEMILSQADMALYKSKNEGRGTYRFFTTALDAEVRDRVTLGAELREAIASDQLFLLYQPQIDVDTSRVIGLEALVRWNHPTRGIILPEKFIAVTEHIGVMAPLGRWVIRSACRQMRKWADAGIAPPLVAVNVSATQFTTPFELERDIATILAESGLQPWILELELTESTLMTVSREHDEELVRLHQSGVRIAIDDFGTGYSSLAYLSRLPVNRIKIGQTFIRDLTATSANAAIVRAAIGMAHELGLDVIVEGVETAEQLELVKSWDAHKVQGFYFARPLPADEIGPLLRAGTIVPR